MTAQSSRVPVMSVLAATSLWGTCCPAQALAHTGANPGAIGAARLLVLGERLAPLAIVGASLLLAGPS